MKELSMFKLNGNLKNDIFYGYDGIKNPKSVKNIFTKPVNITHICNFNNSPYIITIDKDGYIYSYDQNMDIVWETKTGYNTYLDKLVPTLYKDQLERERKSRIYKVNKCFNLIPSDSSFIILYNTGEDCDGNIDANGVMIYNIFGQQVTAFPIGYSEYIWKSINEEIYCCNPFTNNLYKFIPSKDMGSPITIDDDYRFTKIFSFNVPQTSTISDFNVIDGEYYTLNKTNISYNKLDGFPKIIAYIEGNDIDIPKDKIKGSSQTYDELWQIGDTYALTIPYTIDDVTTKYIVLAYVGDNKFKWIPKEHFSGDTRYRGNLYNKDEIPFEYLSLEDIWYIRDDDTYYQNKFDEDSNKIIWEIYCKINTGNYKDNVETYDLLPKDNINHNDSYYVEKDKEIESELKSAGYYTYNRYWNLLDITKENIIKVFSKSDLPTKGELDKIYYIVKSGFTGDEYYRYLKYWNIISKVTEEIIINAETINTYNDLIMYGDHNTIYYVKSENKYYSYISEWKKIDKALSYKLLPVYGINNGDIIYVRLSTGKDIFYESKSVWIKSDEYYKDYLNSTIYPISEDIQVKNNWINYTFNKYDESGKSIVECVLSDINMTEPMYKYVGKVKSYEDLESMPNKNVGDVYEIFNPELNNKNDDKSDDEGLSKTINNVNWAWLTTSLTDKISGEWINFGKIKTQFINKASIDLVNVMGIVIDSKVYFICFNGILIEIDTKNMIPNSSTDNIPRYIPTIYKLTDYDVTGYYQKIDDIYIITSDNYIHKMDSNFREVFTYANDYDIDGVIVDTTGNIYIRSNDTIRKVLPTLVISDGIIADDCFEFKGGNSFIKIKNPLYKPDILIAESPNSEDYKEIKISENGPILMVDGHTQKGYPVNEFSISFMFKPTKFDYNYKVILGGITSVNYDRIVYSDYYDSVFGVAGNLNKIIVGYTDGDDEIKWQTANLMNTEKNSVGIQWLKGIRRFLSYYPNTNKYIMSSNITDWFTRDIEIDIRLTNVKYVELNNYVFFLGRDNVYYTSNIDNLEGNIEYKSIPDLDGNTWVDLAYGNGTYMVISNTTNNIYMSSDLQKWNYSIATSKRLKNCIFNNGKFLVIPEITDCIFEYNYNNNSWDQINLPETYVITNSKVINNHLHIITDKGIIINQAEENGKYDWQIITINDYVVNDIEWYNDRYVMVIKDSDRIIELDSEYNQKNIPIDNMNDISVVIDEDRQLCLVVNNYKFDTNFVFDSSKVDNWYNFIFTCSNSDIVNPNNDSKTYKIINFYVNDTHYNTFKYTGDNIKIKSDYIMIGDINTHDSEEDNFYELYGCINDLSICDYPLSLKEINDMANICVGKIKYNITNTEKEDMIDSGRYLTSIFTNPNILTSSAFSISFWYKNITKTNKLILDKTSKEYRKIDNYHIEKYKYGPNDYGTKIIVNGSVDLLGQIDIIYDGNRIDDCITINETTIFIPDSDYDYSKFEIYGTVITSGIKVEYWNLTTNLPKYTMDEYISEYILIKGYNKKYNQIQTTKIYPISSLSDKLKYAIDVGKIDLYSPIYGESSGFYYNDIYWHAELFDFSQLNLFTIIYSNNMVYTYVNGKIFDRMIDFKYKSDRISTLIIPDKSTVDCLMDLRIYHNAITENDIRELYRKGNTIDREDTYYTYAIAEIEDGLTISPINANLKNAIIINENDDIINVVTTDKSTVITKKVNRDGLIFSKSIGKSISDDSGLIPNIIIRNLDETL